VLDVLGAKVDLNARLTQKDVKLKFERRYITSSAQGCDIQLKNSPPCQPCDSYIGLRSELTTLKT
jgi:hypothetical protein